MTRAFGREVIDRFRDIVAQRLGLHFDDSKRDFLGEVLQRRVHHTGSTDAQIYLQRLTPGAGSRSETAALAEELTVGETYFLRHLDQFRAFTEIALPARLRDRGNTRLRILSAGCASGEEAHSLAILLRQVVPDHAAEPCIVGIDINSAALAKAMQGRYTAWSLRGLAEEIRQRCFRAVGRDFVLDDAVRGLVSFEDCNLMEDAPEFWQPARFDIIFCRNVVMYFTPEAARAVIARLTRSLVGGGFLFLGPAETLRGISNDYHLLHTHDAFYYQRRLAGEAIAPASCAESRTIAASLPLLPVTDDSWVGAIGQASERIARLSERAKKGAAGMQPRPPSAETLVSIQAVRDLIRHERFEDALGMLHNLSADVQDADVQLLHAVILTNCGQVAQADQVCRRVLAGDELNAEAHYLLALCREHEKKLDAAVEEDRTAIYLDAQFAMPHLHLGLVSKRLGDMETARRAFRQAQTLFPREDAARVLLFGGGFSRDMLLQLCRDEVQRCGGDL